MSEIEARFKESKKRTLEAAQNFLMSAGGSQPKLLSANRADINNTIDSLANTDDVKATITDVLKTLETLREAKTGIDLYEQDGVLIRDARSAKEVPVRQTEGFEMQYLNAVRAAIDIAEIEGKPELKDQIVAKAKEGFKQLSEHSSPEDQKTVAKTMKKAIKDLGKLMEDQGKIADVYNKLNVAKDFQNFNDTHLNIVTVSSVTGKDGKDHVVIEAEVAMKGLTDVQKGQYNSLSQPGVEKPAWFKVMPEWEQKLCQKYAPTIGAGTHVIPTQLRQIAGMKNAFEKTTAILQDSGDLKVLHEAKHAGTLASLTKDKDARQSITDENARQAQEWIGSGSKLHCNTFNSGPFGAGDDPEIVAATQKSMQNIGGKETNTAFNAFRYTSLSNDLTGVKDTLKQVADSLPNTPEFKEIKSRLEPQGVFGRLMRGFGGDTMSKIDKLEGVDDKTKAMLKSAVELRRSVEKADRWVRFGDSENSSLQTSTNTGKLMDAIKDMPAGDIKDKLPKEEMLYMCASGKDRTGLAMHDQSAQAIATELGMGVKDIDAQLLRSGHTAQQAGGIYAGGATVGCYGTKSENRAGLPASRKKALEGIIEVTAKSNKIKGESLIQESKVHVVNNSVIPEQQPLLTPEQQQNIGYSVSDITLPKEVVRNANSLLVNMLNEQPNMQNEPQNKPQNKGRGLG